MIGAIIGDIVGSVYEFDNIKTKDFPFFGPRPNANPNYSDNGRPNGESFFTDDTVLTVAVADWLLAGKDDLADRLAHYTFAYPNRGYGGMYANWANAWDRQPYDSYGNGSAMRVSPVAWFAKDQDQVLELAKASAAVTHNHPEGIKGAQAAALAIWMARTGADASQIRRSIMDFAAYDLTETVDEIREWYYFNETCQETVPQAIICALEATSFVDAIRNAISIGGDSDTVAAITGSIAEAMFRVPEEIASKGHSYLPIDMIEILERFNENTDAGRDGSLFESER
jgi:ADP-ribosyl-[dinitrogen reductase] hydrolase